MSGTSAADNFGPLGYLIEESTPDQREETIRKVVTAELEGTKVNAEDVLTRPLTWRNSPLIDQARKSPEGYTAAVLRSEELVKEIKYAIGNGKELPFEIRQPYSKPGFQSREPL
jgi:hypothetical protein